MLEQLALPHGGVVALAERVPTIPRPPAVSARAAAEAAILALKAIPKLLGYVIESRPLLVLWRALLPLAVNGLLNAINS